MILHQILVIPDPTSGVYHRVPVVVAESCSASEYSCTNTVFETLSCRLPRLLRARSERVVTGCLRPRIGSESGNQLIEVFLRDAVVLSFRIPTRC